MSDLTDRVITAGIDIDLEAYKTDTADMLKQIFLPISNLPFGYKNELAGCYSQ